MFSGDSWKEAAAEISLRSQVGRKSSAAGWRGGLALGAPGKQLWQRVGSWGGFGLYPGCVLGLCCPRGRGAAAGGGIAPCR